MGTDMTMVATFFTHFGAVRFKKQCDAEGWKAQMKPVPRSLSSSCGICVEYSVDRHEESLPDTDESTRRYLPEDFSREEVEQVVEVTPEGYRWLYKAEDN